MFTLSACRGWFDGSYCDRVKAAAANNFKALEILGWKDLDLGSAAACLKENGIQLSSILIQSTCPEKQELIANTHGIVWEDSFGAFADALRETLAAAKILGTNRIIVTSGNERFDVSRGYQHDNIVKALSLGAEIVKGSGVKIVLEPLNILVDHMGYFLTTTAESIEIIKEVGSDDVMLLFDVYHQQITEGNVINNIRNNIKYIGHVHVGDNPGRKEPGTGEINYKNVFKAIAETDYDGFVVFECGRTESADVVCRKMLSLI